MTRALLAGFAGPAPLTAAVDAVREGGGATLEAYTPFPMPELTERFGHTRTNIPWWMLAGGLAMATAFFFMEWLSATRLYAFDLGGRPDFSWPAFCVATVEVSVLAAGLAGFVAFMLKAGLPRLNHPVFDYPSFLRASQDQFILAVALPEATDAAGQTRVALFDAGAVWIEEAEL